MFFSENNMDTALVNLATGLSQTKLSNSVDVAVASKTLDAARQQGAAVVQLIDAARGPSQPGVGEQVDVTV